MRQIADIPTSELLNDKAASLMEIDVVQKLRFNGPAYDPERDGERLSNQYRRIFSLMKDGEWRTLEAVARQTGAPEASVSAQLRHMRKPRFGGHTVERRHVYAGLYEYRLLVAVEAEVKA